MQSVSSRIWNWHAVSISYDENYYTTQNDTVHIKDKVKKSREKSSTLLYTLV